MPDTTLPGLLFMQRDGGLIVTPTQPTTDSVLIIGTAVDGPVNTPYNANNFSGAQALFGPLIFAQGYVNPQTGVSDGASSHNSLMKAMHEALLGGAGNIQLCRVGGNISTLNIGGTGALGLQFNGYYPGNIYNGNAGNGQSIAITQAGQMTTITVVQPTIKGSTLTYQFPNVNSTLLLVANTINNDNLNGTVKVSLSSSSYNLPASGLTPAVGYMTGGSNGTDAPGDDLFSSKAAYYNNLTDSGTYNLLGTSSGSGTFASLQDAEFDLCVLAGIYGDDQVDNTTSTSVAVPFVQFLYNVSKQTYPCHGVLGLRPTNLSSVTDLTAFVNANYLGSTTGSIVLNGAVDTYQRWNKFGPIMSAGFTISDPDLGNTVDAGRYLSVVAGPDCILAHKDLGLYTENGAAVYAGLISSLPHKDAATQSPLGSVSSLLGNFSYNIRKFLTAGVGYKALTNTPGKGAYVTFHNSIDAGRPIVTQDVTVAARNSDYKYLQIYRITSIAQHLVRAAVLPFIGKGMDPASKNSMNASIKSALDQLADAGALLGGQGIGYNFSLSWDAVQQAAGTVVVELQLRPSQQLRFIEVTVAVSN